jgi:hypothetical protein
MTFRAHRRCPTGATSDLCDFRKNVFCKGSINVEPWDHYIRGHRKTKSRRTAMTTISHALTHYHLGARRRHSRSFSHGAGIGIVLALVVLAMVAVSGRAGPESQYYHAWPVANETPSVAGWENSVPPELFPLGPVTVEAPQ